MMTSENANSKETNKNSQQNSGVTSVLTDYLLILEQQYVGREPVQRI